MCLEGEKIVAKTSGAVFALFMPRVPRVGPKPDVSRLLTVRGCGGQRRKGETKKRRGAPRKARRAARRASETPLGMLVAGPLTSMAAKVWQWGPHQQQGGDPVGWQRRAGVHEGATVLVPYEGVHDLVRPASPRRVTPRRTNRFLEQRLCPDG